MFKRFSRLEPLVLYKMAFGTSINFSDSQHQCLHDVFLGASFERTTKSHPIPSVTCRGGGLPHSCVSMLFLSARHYSDRRTSRNYRRASFGLKQTILQTAKQTGTSVSSTLSSQEAFASPSSSKVTSSGRNPGRFLEYDRHAYLRAAVQHFETSQVISLVADAVHVGNDSWLNRIASSNGKSFVCPPQANSRRNCFPPNAPLWFLRRFLARFSN